MSESPQAEFPFFSHHEKPSFIETSNHFDCIKSAFSLGKKEFAKSQHFQNDLLSSPTLQPKSLETEKIEYGLDSESLLEEYDFNFISINQEYNGRVDSIPSPGSSLKYAVYPPSQSQPTINFQERESQASLGVEEKVERERVISKTQPKKLISRKFSRKGPLKRKNLKKKIKKHSKGPIQKNSLKILGDKCIRNLVYILSSEGEVSDEKNNLKYIIKYKKSRFIDYKQMENPAEELTKKEFITWLTKNWMGRFRTLKSFREAFDYKNKLLRPVEAHFRRVLCYHAKSYFKGRELSRYIKEIKTEDKRIIYEKIASGIAGLVDQPHKIRCLTQFL